MLIAGGALANDSTAQLTTGGLVLTRTDAIEMQSEDLFISEREIRVRYRFLNTSAADVTTTVAFPMPDIETGPDMNVAIPNAGSDNLLNFRTVVDARPVEAVVVQKAMLNGVDHTERLRKLGVPLNVAGDGPTRAMDALPEADRAELVRLGLADVDEYDAGKGWERHLAPRWTLKSIYHWRQTFPAGRPVEIEHVYQPSVGGSVDTILGSTWGEAAEVADMRRRYCIDDAFMAVVAKRRKAAGGGETAALSEARIDYVLTTGANWKKPIGDFRLTVDKGKPGNIVSFCADDVRKVSPTRFEVRRTNFTPTRDLSVLILGDHGEGQ